LDRTEVRRHLGVASSPLGHDREAGEKRAEETGSRVLVVVSALSGVTNELTAIADGAPTAVIAWPRWSNAMKASWPNWAWAARCWPSAWRRCRACSTTRVRPPVR
jgi:hypothetical protein